MNNVIDFQPNWVSAPGNTIKDILEERNMPINELANNMHVTYEIVSDLLVGKSQIDVEIAKKLENVLGASTNFWLKREAQYRQSVENINNDMSTWIKSLPLKDMLASGWIDSTGDIFKACLDFFDVPDIMSWRLKYSKGIENLSFRTSQTYTSDEGSIASWLRRGELITQNYDCKPWDKEHFIENLEKIKKLTRSKNPKDFIPQLIQYCCESGVAVAIVPTPKGCKASGATGFLTKNRAILLLSFRYLSDDQFWFTFFHEAGHLVLHDKDKFHIEVGEKETIQTDEEAEANAFAAEMLIPYQLQSEMKYIRGNMKRLLGFAIKAGVSPGIVIGQMQHLGLVDYKYLNGYKRRYNWDDIMTGIQKFK